jgi:hypothetical protein
VLAQAAFLPEGAAGIYRERLERCDRHIDVVGWLEVVDLTVRRQEGDHLPQRRVHGQSRSQVEDLLVLALEGVEPADVDAAASGGLGRRLPGFGARRGGKGGGAAEGSDECATVVFAGHVAPSIGTA